MSTRLAVFAAAFALTSPALLPPAGASAVACVPGHNTVIPPCTYDSGLLSLDGYSPASGTEVTGGGGHHTVVSFPSSSFGAGIQAAADVGYPPFSATDSGRSSSASPWPSPAIGSNRVPHSCAGIGPASSKPTPSRSAAASL